MLPEIFVYDGQIIADGLIGDLKRRGDGLDRDIFRLLEKNPHDLHNPFILHENPSFQIILDGKGLFVKQTKS